MAVSELAARIVKHRGWFGSASRGCNLVESARGPGRINNYVLRIPGPAERYACIGDYLRWPAGYRDSLHLEEMEETKGAAVRRPERKAGVVGPGQELGRVRIQFADPELCFAAGYGRKCNPPPVW